MSIGLTDFNRMIYITIIVVVWIIAEYWSRTVIAIKGEQKSAKPTPDNECNNIKQSDNK